VEDGERFFRLAKEAAKRKPVIIYKGGLSEMGKRAVASHTASMGGQKEIWEALIKQVGAVQVHDFDELCNTILAFTLLPPRCYRGMTALGGGGALGVAACDEAETHGLFFPKLSGPIYETIAQDLPKPGSSGDNPIDVANPFVSPHVLGKIMREAAKDNRVDIQVPIILFYHFKQLVTRLGFPSLRDCIPLEQYVTDFAEAKEKTGKPVVLVLPNHRQEVTDLDLEEALRHARREFLARGIPVYNTLTEAMRAIHNVASYYAKQASSWGQDPGKER